MFAFRLAEHEAEVSKVKKKYPRSERKASEKEQTKSAISDHVARANHVIDFENPKIIGREHDKKSREIKEAMEIRKRGDKTLNREEGTYLLSHVYDPLLRTGNKTIQSSRTGNKTNQSNRKSTRPISRESDQMSYLKKSTDDDGRI